MSFETEQQQYLEDLNDRFKDGERIDQDEDRKQWIDLTATDLMQSIDAGEIVMQARNADPEVFDELVTDLIVERAKCGDILAADDALYQFVRKVALQWAERAHFKQFGY